MKPPLTRSRTAGCQGGNWDPTIPRNMLSTKALMFIPLFFAGLGIATGTQRRPLERGPISACPFGPEDGVRSPDKLWTILCTHTPEPAIWLMNERSKHRRFLLECPSTIAVGWAPNSKSFFVNDHKASDEGYAFVYDTLSLRVLRVGKLLAGADPESAKYLRAGHHYVDVLQWRNSQEVLVRVSGHFDRHPACEFELRHRVRLNGLVAKISERAWLPR
jgi:hypothetical protein